MAQNISISEGGQARQFGQINKLKISNSGGGASLWVPEDDVQTKSLYVDKNGTYYSSKDDCYGYDEVSVNIIDEVFGYDDDGNYWDVDVDDDGFLEEEKMLSYIKIITPPDKLKYKNLETIKKDGMVVVAYYGDDTEYGTIPNEELVLIPPIAMASETHGGTYRSVSGSTSTYNITPPHDTAHEGYFSGNRYVTVNGSDIRAVAAWIYNGFSYKSTFVTYFVSKSPFTAYYYGIYQEDKKYGKKGDRTPDTQISVRHITDTVDGVAYDFYICGYEGYIANGVIVPSSSIPIDENIDENNDIQAYEDCFGEGAHAGGQDIQVGWKRSQDDELLTDTFTITIDGSIALVINGNESGGSSGGSW